MVSYNILDAKHSGDRVILLVGPRSYDTHLSVTSISVTRVMTHLSVTSISDTRVMERHILKGQDVSLMRPVKVASKVLYETIAVSLFA